MKTEITREAIEALAKEQGVTPVVLVTMLQTGAATLDDSEVTLDQLCAIKAELLGL